MIKINLAPAEELESPLWWVADALTFAAVLGAAMLVSYLILANIRYQIDTVTVEKSKFDRENESLKADVDRYASLSKEIAELQRIKDSYSRITETKLARYLPIIILEHLQNLKPQGIWFTKVEFLSEDSTKGQDGNPTAPIVAEVAPVAGALPGAVENEGQNPLGQNPARGKKTRGNATAGVSAESKDHVIMLTGNALNNVILGEFMTVIQATQNQEFDPSDLRSQAYFKVVNLGFSKAKRLTAASQDDKEQKADNASVDIVEFEVKIPYSERVSGEAPVNMKLSGLLGEKKPELKILK